MTTVIERLRALARWWRGPVADPCTCGRPAPVVIYDANGWRCWCGRCGGRLWDLP